MSAHPNAGLPNEFGGYDESPETMAEMIGEFARSGLVNIVGGCCGTKPEHIAAFGKAISDVPPRAIPEKPKYMRLSGLEPFTLTPDLNFINVGERTNITGSAKFRKLIAANDYEAALDIARNQVENGAQIIDINMDEGLIDSEAAMTRFVNLIAGEPDISKVPLMIGLSVRRSRHLQRRIGALWYCTGTDSRPGTIDLRLGIDPVRLGILRDQTRVGRVQHRDAMT